MVHIHVTLHIYFFMSVPQGRETTPLHPDAFPHKLQRQASVLLTLQIEFALKKKKKTVD